jgi:phosphoribosylcarboxyaminoimidazole (NCAIR) mutase
MIGAALAIGGLAIYYSTGSGAAAKGGWSLGCSTFIALFIISAKVPGMVATLTRIPVVTDIVLTLVAFVAFNQLFKGVTATPAAIVFGLLVSAGTSLGALYRAKKLEAQVQVSN